MAIKTPWELAKTGSEHSEQVALFAWANFAAMFGFAYANDEKSYKAIRQTLAPGFEVPKLKRLFAVHNQGHGDKLRGAMAKAEGVKAGVPDIMLPCVGHQQTPPDLGVLRYYGLFIELKRKEGFKTNVSTEQLDWVAYLNNAGYKAVVCYGWKDAAKTIQEYLGG